MNTNNNIINILWTGGWDSSYRMAELSREEVIVQPIYFYGDGRISEQYERRAISSILKALQKKEDTLAEIRPVNFIHIKDIPYNEKITDAYNTIYNETKLGSQHEWLARYAYENPGIELGTELAPLNMSKILNTINKYGRLVYDTKDSTYKLDKSNSSQDIMYILGNFSYPIIDKTGKDMLENIKQWGYEDVMQHVWVCHTPILGKPCGTCHPCELKIETGMELLMKPKSIKRYYNREKTPYKYLYRIQKKMTRSIDRVMFTVKQ